MKEWLKKNRWIYACGKQVNSIIYNRGLNYRCTVENWLRCTKSYKGKYRGLQKYHQIHKGKRCFIVATGPSLTISDLNLLQNEITFSMNSICMSLEETSWRPTYYGIQDMNVYQKLEKTIKKSDLSTIFISSQLATQYQVPKEWEVYPIHYLNHYYQSAKQKVHTRFSDNIVGAVYDGYSIAYSLLQIAVYMGFSEIYLLGTDCNYTQNGAHHFKEYGFKDPNYLTVGEKMIYAYKVANEYAKKHGIKIYNATRGGKLEVFERVKLEDVLAKKEVAYE